MLAVPNNLAVAELVGYNLLYSYSKNFDLFFLKPLCLFLSVVALGSAVSFLNCSVESNIPTTLPLFCFRITVLLLLNKLSITYLYL